MQMDSQQHLKGSLGMREAFFFFFFFFRYKTWSQTQINRFVKQLFIYLFLHTNLKGETPFLLASTTLNFNKASGKALRHLSIVVAEL